MKALTICQPYAELIARHAKRVENREWSTNYRGELLIHAGKSRAWLNGDTDEDLFVATNGPYFGLENVDPWDEPRDARQYAEPHRVVAHPPCERWGRYWGGGPSVKVPKKLGDDGGCFAAALEAVRRWGGVLEHPEASHAWHHFGLNYPARDGWITADFQGGWTCCVEQGHYGHRARKATWLYVCGIPGHDLPRLQWGPSEGERLDEGFHSNEERQAARAAGQTPRKRLSSYECLATPLPFRDLLLSIARGAHTSGGDSP